MTGYVYVMTNEAMPGLCKIGKTSNDPEKRAAELFNTSCPMPFKVEYKARCVNPCRVEKLAHTHLFSSRVTNNREFFKCSIYDAEIAISEAIERAAKEPCRRKRKSLHDWEALLPSKSPYEIGCLQLHLVVYKLLSDGMTIEGICDGIGQRGGSCDPPKLIKILRGKVPSYSVGSAIVDMYYDHMQPKKRTPQ